VCYEGSPGRLFPGLKADRFERRGLAGRQRLYGGEDQGDEYGDGSVFLRALTGVMVFASGAMGE
jgi:hypothetical protein